ncbi:MAG TPA: 3-oxoacyl-ACP reductase family protein [Jiangellaceae bacterium]|nr:3-oxoacyl-ACP reductase family protein [Jiangellaceae bacterium]
MTTDQFRLDGRVVLVTGGNRGIGAAVARTAAALGADIGIGYHSGESEAEKVCEEITATGRRCVAFAADISESAQARGLVRAAEDAFGRVDGLVNNAGIMPSKDFLEITDEEWDLVIRTNVSSMFWCCQAVIPGMLERGAGSIVNISSRLGQIGWPAVTHYSVAKAGVLALTKSLGRAYGSRGVRTNAVAPGVTNTEMGRTVMSGEVGEQRRRELPLGRFAEPEDVANAVVFLLSDASATFLGQTLNPNAGGLMP